MKLRYAILCAVALVSCAPVETTSTAPSSARSDAEANPVAYSARLQAADTTLLCSTYGSAGTTGLAKQMIEAELAVRGVNQCSGVNIGAQTAAQVGVARYSRGGTDTGVSGQDYDCSNFNSGASAQRFFLASGGPTSDPHNLDGDGDGLACEWGTQVRRIASYTPPPAPRAVATPVVSTPRSTGGRTCYTGPRGGTYTITSGGKRNYSGC